MATSMFGWFSLQLETSMELDSVLGPVLFLIFIYNLDDNISSNVLKYANDAKLFCEV